MQGLLEAGFEERVRRAGLRSNREACDAGFRVPRCQGPCTSTLYKSNEETEVDRGASAGWGRQVRHRDWGEPLRYSRDEARTPQEGNHLWYRERELLCRWWREEGSRTPQEGSQGGRSERNRGLVCIPNATGPVRFSSSLCKLGCWRWSRFSAARGDEWCFVRIRFRVNSESKSSKKKTKKSKEPSEEELADKAAKFLAKEAEKEKKAAAKAAEKEAEKVKKAAEKEAEKVKKAAEKEAEKAKKLAEKEAEKAKKLAEKAAKEEKPKKEKKASKKKAEEPVKPVEPVADLESESESEDEEPVVAVKKFEHQGVTYLKSGDGVLYDAKTQSVVGKWNETSKSIEVYNDESEEESDSDDE